MDIGHDGNQQLHESMTAYRRSHTDHGVDQQQVRLTEDCARKETLQCHVDQIEEEKKEDGIHGD